MVPPRPRTMRLRWHPRMVILYLRVWIRWRRNLRIWLRRPRCRDRVAGCAQHDGRAFFAVHARGAQERQTHHVQADAVLGAAVTQVGQLGDRVGSIAAVGKRAADVADAVPAQKRSNGSEVGPSWQPTFMRTGVRALLRPGLTTGVIGPDSPRRSPLERLADSPKCRQGPPPATMPRTRKGRLPQVGGGWMGR